VGAVAGAILAYSYVNPFTHNLPIYVPGGGHRGKHTMPPEQQARNNPAKFTLG